MINIFFYLFYTLISVLGLYLFKISTMGFNLLFILGIIFYGSGFLLWLFILKTNSLSIAFPIASSMLIIATQFVGFYFLQENFSFSKLVGITFIILGILIIYQGEFVSWTK
ncbi:hypothetical protein [Aliarcobacter cryaerophilus]|uniref:hypothetical protein n=1 Tax=Aliarcobacter cryaerophilus TaxID=28198 RepID=UPI003DA349BE